MFHSSRPHFRFVVDPERQQRARGNKWRIHSASPRCLLPALGGESGLTLLDSIVALGLLLLCTATLGTFLVQQLHTGGVNVSYSTAYALAAEEIEELRALDYANVASRTRTVSEGALTYSVDTVVRADTPEPNMKHITVDVTWNDPGVAQRVTVETIYTAVRR